MATWVTTQGGLWSKAPPDATSPWYGGGNPILGLPGSGDSVTITAGHTVTFDVNQTVLLVGLAALTVNGTLVTSTTAGTYYLKMAANIIIGAAGEVRTGTSALVPYPQTCSMTYYFNGAYGFSNFNTTGKLNLFCTEPTIKHIKLSAATIAGATVLPVDTSVVGDIWAVGNTVYVCDIAGNTVTADAEARVIKAGGIAAGSITLVTGLTNEKSSESYVVLAARNISILGTTGVTSVINAPSNCVINAAVTGTTSGYGITSSLSCSLGGVWFGLSRGVYNGAGSTIVLGNTINGVIVGCTNGVYQGFNYTITGSVLGCTNCIIGVVTADIPGLVGAGYSGLQFGGNINMTGTILGCTYGSQYGAGHNVSGTITKCTAAFYAGSDHIFSGTASNCTFGIYYGSGFNVTSATFTSILTADIYGTPRVRLTNTTFSAGVSQYNTLKVPTWSYIHSYHHNRIVGTFQAWSRGGITVSDVTPANLPVGYAVVYKHTCEDATMQNFRQVSVSIPPGVTIIVDGYIRIADDHSAWAPRLEIINCTADPLFSLSYTPLATTSVDQPNGTVVGFQPVQAKYTNESSLVMEVLLRVSAKRASGDIYEAITWTTQYAVTPGILIPKYRNEENKNVVHY